MEPPVAEPLNRMERWTVSPLCLSSAPYLVWWVKVCASQALSLDRV